MKKLCLILLAILPLALCACQKQPEQQQPAQAEQTTQETQETAAARFATQQEVGYYLEDHAALDGNLPAFCEATENGVAEKFKTGAEILKTGRERFAEYLFARLDRLPEDAFADDAVWTCSDTPRGNLLLEGPEVRLIYNAGEDEVHPPRKAEVDEDLLATLKTRYEQAGAVPDIDQDGPQVQALTGYLRENPEIFCDDGVSVFEDTAWMLRQAESDAVLLSFLWESPFCGLACGSLLATEDGYVKVLPQECLDEGWFLNEAEDDYLLKRFAAVNCDKQTAERMAQWLQQQVESADTEPFLENFPCLRSVLADAKKAVWLTEQTADGTRMLFLSPDDRTYRDQQDDASTLTVWQLYDVDGEILQGMPGVLWTTCHNVAPSLSEVTVGDFWTHQMLSDISFSATYGFYLLENEPWVTDAAGVGWARFSNEQLELWVLDSTVYILRSESEDYLLPSGFGVGSRLEAFQAFFSESTPVPEKNAAAVIESFNGFQPIPANEIAGGWYYNGGTHAIFYTVGADGIITQMILEGPV